MRALLALVCCFAALGARGADWRQFRGPQSSGVSDETGLPTILDKTHNIAWRIPLPGRGLSSPIIVGDRIFVTACSGARQERLHVLCFNAADGSKRWERRFWATGRTCCHEKISVAAPSPASDGEHLLALFSSNDLFCLDLDGRLLWLRGLMRDYPNAGNNLGLASSPVIEEGTLIVQVETDGAAFAAGIDVLTGLNRWKIDRPRRVNWTSPIVVRGSDGKGEVILQSPHGLDAVVPSSGKILWSYTGGSDAMASSVACGQTLLVPSRGLTTLDLSGGGQGAKTRWQSNLLRPATASPLVLSERVFTLNDAAVLTCGDVTNGKRVWQLRLKGPISASPVAAGQHVYCVSEKGLVQVVNPGTTDGATVSELDLGETIIATPSIGGGAIYFRSDRSLWKIGK